MKKTLLYLTAFTGGLSVLVMEILGTRLVSPFYGATIFVWTSLIAVTLGALALGYWLGGLFIDRYPTSKTFFSTVVWSGILFLLPIKLDQWVLFTTDSLGLKFGPLVSAFVLFFIPLLLLGTFSPMVIRLVTTDARSSGHSSGSVFAISTVGSIVGGLLAGFVLIPLYSITQIFTGVGVILVVLGMGGVVSGGGLDKRTWLFIFFSLILFLGLLSVSKVEIGHRNLFKVIDHKQSYLGDIKVVDLSGTEYFRCLFVNGSGQTCINEKGETDGFFQRFLRSELPKFGLSENSKVLVLGLGGGGVLSMFPREIEVDVVELDEEVVSSAKEHFFFEEHDNLTVVVDDARHYLATAQQGQYDLILENIALGNSIPSYILSSESFSDMKRLLTEDGILLAHIGSFEIDGDNIFNRAVYSTAASQFEYALALSSQPSYVSHLVLYLADNPISEDFIEEVTVVDMSYEANLVINDDKNPLEYYYLSNAISQRDSVIGLGGELFYAN